MFIKDSKGQKSFTVTISIITFAVVMFKVLVGGASLSIGGFSMEFGTIGSDEIVALLAPTLGSYTFRRYTDRRYREFEDAEPPLPGEEGAM